MEEKKLLCHYFSAEYPDDTTVHLKLRCWILPQVLKEVSDLCEKVKDIWIDERTPSNYVYQEIFVFVHNS